MSLSCQAVSPSTQSNSSGSGEGEYLVAKSFQTCLDQEESTMTGLHTKQFMRTQSCRFIMQILVTKLLTRSCTTPSGTSLWMVAKGKKFMYFPASLELHML